MQLACALQRAAAKPAAKLTIALLDFMQALLFCWPSHPIVSPQVSQILLPAAQLVLPAFRLTLQILAGRNRTLFSKLYRPCIVFGLALAQAYVREEQLSGAAAAAHDGLMRSALLPQLQLLLLAVALKTHYHMVRVESSSSSGSSSSGSRQAATAAEPEFACVAAQISSGDVQPVWFVGRAGSSGSTTRGRAIYEQEQSDTC
jgi:hypothetical protein